jgi:aminomuconate-semialdehyde/2-hydroxymuconate-6-semialdehyde dehydrogenase
MNRLERTVATTAIPEKELANFIGGRWISTGQRFENRSPIDGSLNSLVHEAGQAEVSAAVDAARDALTGPWGTLPVDQRGRMLHAIADGILRRFDDFVAAEIADTGMPIQLAKQIDVPRGAANFRVFADLFQNVPTESFQMLGPEGNPVLNYGVRVPRGVVAVICPWNFPLLLMTWKVGPALACGNTVVVKPSEETPTTTTLLAEVMAEVGVPDGVFNVLHGFGPNSTGEMLIKHPGVDGITFTGETATGEVIMRAAADGVRPVSFELGGKNPAIVFADADLDSAIAALTRSVFQNTGQVCLGTERLYVERPIFEQFVSRLKMSAESLTVGRPTEQGVTLGPLISQAHRKKVLTYYERAVADGAHVVTGGGIPRMPDSLAAGAWIEPTIWTGLRDDSRICTEEIFGPCCHIAPFDTVEEVIKRANSTSYGLAASVWTRDLATAHRLAAALQVGVCWINSWFLRDLRTAFGGAKQSGIGREGGIHGLEFYTELRNVCVNW